jgi:hypothetical protein
MLCSHTLPFPFALAQVDHLLALPLNLKRLHPDALCAPSIHVLVVVSPYTFAYSPKQSLPNLDTLQTPSLELLSHFPSASLHITIFRLPIPLTLPPKRIRRYLCYPRDLLSSTILKAASIRVLANASSRFVYV